MTRSSSSRSPVRPTAPPRPPRRPSPRPPGGAALRSLPAAPLLEELRDVRALLRRARAMVGLHRASFRRVPRRIVLDVDGTFDAVHGGQRLRLFNACHDEYGFQPIVVSDGGGRPVAGRLRA